MSKYKSGWMEFEEASYLSDLFQQIVADCKVYFKIFYFYQNYDFYLKLISVIKSTTLEHNLSNSRYFLTNSYLKPRKLYKGNDIRTDKAFLIFPLRIFTSSSFLNL